MKLVTLICDECRQVIKDNDYCTPHVTHAWSTEHSDKHYHTDCCPECNADTETIEDAAWQDFLSNERLHETAESMGL